MDTDEDFKDFKDLDVYLSSDEFNDVYNNAVYIPTGKSWAGDFIDYNGMILEDFGR